LGGLPVQHRSEASCRRLNIEPAFDQIAMLPRAIYVFPFGASSPVSQRAVSESVGRHRVKSAAMIAIE